MRFKKGYEDALNEASISKEEFTNQFVEFSGNEVETIIQYSLPRNCKSRFNSKFSIVKFGEEIRNTFTGQLPKSFFDEWDGKSVKLYKELLFGKYLTQEFFENDPVNAMKLCRGWSQNQRTNVPQELEDEYSSIQSIVNQLKRSLRQLRQ